MSQRVDGKVALITGSARGQGAAHARCLAANGASVVVSDVRDELGESVADEINAAGNKAIYRHLDVRSNEDWEGAVALAESEFGSLDILVNNAGILGGIAGPDECSDEEWDAILATNLTGAFKGIRASIPALRRSGSGAIVNISSIFGLKGTWGYAGYVASKSAIIGITRSAAIQFGPEKIRVNVICPSAVNTPMFDEEMEIFENDEYFDWDEWISSKPLPRVAEPEEISEMVLFLASDSSLFCTGGIFTADGGYMA